MRTGPIVLIAAIVAFGSPAPGSVADERYAAALSELEHGRTPEAVAALREVHEVDPSHEPTARLLAVVERLSPPCPDPDLAPIAALVPGVRVARGNHVLLLHGRADDEAAARVEVLERVVLTFYLSFAARGIDLPPPGHRLPIVWFPRRSQYLAYLRRDGLGAFLNTAGYFHPSRRVVFHFDQRDEPEHRRERGRLDALRREIARRAAIDPGDPGLPALRLDHDRRARALDDRIVERDLGTAVHELIHLLVLESGLAPRLDAFPVWLHEGLAAQFEVVEGGRWAGVGRVHPIRLADWRAIRDLPPMATIVRDIPFRHGYRRDPYAAAWALVAYLRQSRPDAFLDFLARLRASEPSPDRDFAAFRAAFGPDLDGLEAGWRRFARD